MEKFRVCVVGLFLVIVSSLSHAQEPYGTCQSGCNVVTMACYAARGVVYGTGYAPDCSRAQGTCMHMCRAATVGATPLLAAASTVGADAGAGAALGAGVVAAGATITAVAAGVVWLFTRNRPQNQNAAN